MLLLHQTGSVKIGEIVRYTVTYKPSADHILPSPEFLYLRIKNTCAIPLRAAFVHGPYTLSVAAYPSVFKPFEKFENPRRYGVPEFEPMLKPGAVWNCHLVVPDTIRQSAGEGSSKHGHFGGGPEHDDDTVSWVIEVTSQVIFSASASVHYEVLLARDEKSLNLGSVVPVIGGQAHVPQPGRVRDFQHAPGAAHHHHSSPPKGVFSKAVHLKVEDTAALWNTPHLPGWDDMGWLRAREHQDVVGPPAEPATDTATGSAAGTATESGNPQEARRQPKRRQKKVHLVVLTHGLHSNLGGDMLFLKESIDAAVKQAKFDAKARKAREQAARNPPVSVSEEVGLGVGSETTPVSESEQQTDPSHNQNAPDGREHVSTADEDEDDDDDDDDEEVIVRGFSGNATKTERGIKYLGKRLARYILSMTYPDQPCLPTAKAASEAIAHSLKTSSHKRAADEAHKHSSVRQPPPSAGARLYKFTKISFIAHSLGGPVQTYAVAYIQKHSPQFFDLIEPVNFIAMASPFLGLNHENPLYVKFALDFGLVGRTGQDLGLTWRAPTIARNGWGALVSNLGEHAQKRVYGEPQPESKPLLRILPTGPAHKALKKFRNRTVYSNVVNDGIVPLRTSCLLFLDWQGLGRVEKARREAGLVETVVGFGWAELTGATVTTPRLSPWSPVEPKGGKDEPYSTGETTPTGVANSHEVPQPPSNAMLEDDRQSLRSLTAPFHESTAAGLQNLQSGSTTTSNPFSSFFTFFRSETPKPPPPPSPKLSKIYQRSQTIRFDSGSTSDSTASFKSKVTAGNELTDEQESSMSAPPRTTIFESAGDLLNPKLPPVEFLIDPSKRPRTIFHDRVYHPADIPPPPLKQRSSSPLNLRRRTPSAMSSTQKSAKSETPSPPPTQQSNASSKQTVGSAGGGDESTVHTPSFDKDRPPTGDDVLDPDIDTSQMRVEEKIARAYHRGLSWRKVLVKLEPDAHNNIVVRRTFANAFGWPVVQHLVESHFSDSATARLRDEDEPNVERAMALRRKPGPAGGETEAGGVGSDAHGLRVSIDNGGDGEDGRGEEGDTLSPLPLSPGLGPGHQLGMGSGTASPTTPRIGLDRRDSVTRIGLDRRDSVTWSERDWIDSGDESDDGVGSSGKATKKEADGKGKGVTAGGGLGVALPGERSASPLIWNWTEKIVGRGAAGRSKSPGGDAGGKK
ncbi:putative serine esterase-domain-containing protein [Staphylotrichum tortipilum]|uniref:Serine esterase-domain-containing protein n=1 Tax=Staphylotrichum tortipilum TaxID=2831512 RepID=A0AAN6RQK1_9PEZI|nr:putative serine esterase-domain-containing protein [Staphylotrichum longicolle]